MRPFGADVVGRDLLQGRRAEGLAVAGLEGQLRRGAPDQPGARTGFAAEDLVIVQARAEGQRPVLAQGDFVLDEHRLMHRRIGAADQAGVLQTLVTMLATDRQGMAVAEMESQAGVPDVVAQRLRTGRREILGALVGHVELRAGEAQLRLQRAPVGVPGQRILASIQLVGVQIIGSRVVGVLLLAVAGFVAAQHVQLQRLALDRAVAQGEAAGLAILAFHFGNPRVLLPGRRFAA